MKKVELNLRPSGIRWEEEDVVLVTNADQAYIQKTGRAKQGGFGTYDNFGSRHPELSDNWVAIPGGIYDAAALDINFVENVEHPYMSISSFHIKASNLDTFYEEGNHLKNLAEYKRYDDLDLHIECELETRVYQNRRLVNVVQATDIDTEETFYWVETESLAKKMVDRWNHIEYISDALKDSYGFTDFKAHILNTAGVQQVWTNEDVYQYAWINGVKTRYLFKYYQSAMGVFSDQKIIYRDRYHAVYNFKKELRDKINTFFGVFDENHADEKQCFDMKYAHPEYWLHRDVDNGIPNLIFLDYWTALKTSTIKLAKSQSDFLTEIVPRLTWNKGYCTWERMDDRYVVCTYYPSEEHTEWWYRNAFIYDTVKKTRKVVEWDYHTEKAKLAMPSLCDKILSTFRLSKPEKRWDSSKGAYVELPLIKTKIVGGLTPIELFKGTNLEWMLQNMDAFGDDFKFVMLNGGRWSGGTTVFDFKKEMCSERIGVVSLAVLATSGDRLLEQLLKSKLFKMYFLALWGQSVKQKVFFDLDKEYKQSYAYNFGYHSKAKNLKGMLGMNMNQLRMIESQITIAKREEKYWGGSSDTWTYQNIPTTQDVIECFNLGEKGLTVLDEKTFKRVISLGDGRPTGNARWRNQGICTAVVNSEKARSVINRMTLTEQLKFLENSTAGDIEAFEDYLMMRENMKEAHEKKPDKIAFDETHYPMKPDKASKFIAYIPGMTRPDRSWDPIINTEGKFMDYINSTYRDYATEDKSIIPLYDGDRFGGVVVKMNPIQHMKFLHDELSRWYTYYQDEAKQVLFEAAVKRVEPLQWSDEEYGLSIVAPKTTHDLQEEGRVLSHCVASYVDPIINGTENVMFIRRNDMINSPYFTIDIVKGDIRQIHCYRNGDVSPEDIRVAYANSKLEVYNKPIDILGFLKKWAKAMKGLVNPKSIKEHSGVYGALR